MPRVVLVRGGRARRTSVRSGSTSGRSTAFRDVRFDGEVWAVPEGRIVHAGEPILEVTAPIAEAQLVETLLLNQVTLHTTLASKAARYVLAAPTARTSWTSRSGATHGVEAAMAAARASAIVGFAGDLERRGRARVRPPTVAGTMAHSFIEAFPTASARRSGRSRRTIPTARRSWSTRTTR